MGLNLDFVPDLVKSVAPALAGGAFPEADVDRIMREADALDQIAAMISQIEAEDVDRLLASLRGPGWKGEAKNALQTVLAQLTEEAPRGDVSGGALLKRLEDSIRAEAANLREYGVQMQHTQWMIYASLALLALAIVRLLVWIYVNGPGVLAAIYERTLLTKMSIDELKRQVLANMARFAGIMGGLDLGVQTAQKEWGHREHYDVGSLLLSTGSGALAGAVFTGMDFGLSRLLAREVRYVASSAELALREKMAAFGQALYGRALMGGVAGTAGSVPGLAMSGQLDSSHLFYSFVSGVVGGLDVPAGARSAYHPMTAVAELGGPPAGNRSGSYGTPPPGGGAPSAFPHTVEAGRHSDPASSASQPSHTTPAGHGSLIQPSHTTPAGHGTVVQPSHTTLAGAADQSPVHLNHAGQAPDGGRPESASAATRYAPPAESRPQADPVRVDAGTVVYPAGTHTPVPRGDGGPGRSGFGEGEGSGGRPTGSGDRPAGTGQAIAGEVVRRQDSPLPAAPGDTAHGTAVVPRQSNEVGLAGDRTAEATIAPHRADAPARPAPPLLHPSVPPAPHDDQAQTDTAAPHRAEAPARPAPPLTHPSVPSAPHDGQVQTDTAALADRSAPRSGDGQGETPGAPQSPPHGPGRTGIAPAPRPNIDELINQGGAVRPVTPERPPVRSAPTGELPSIQQGRPSGDSMSTTGNSGRPGEVATVPPAQPPTINPPRYVEIGAVGETALHEVRIPADPGGAARKWVDGIPGDLSPGTRAKIKTWLADQLSTADREKWTDLLQKGAALSIGNDVVYLKPEMRDFSARQTPDGPRPYPVSFGGDGVEGRGSASRHSARTSGVAKMWDTTDEVEALALPGVGIRHSSRASDVKGVDVMSGRKQVAFQHDFFDAGLSFGIYRNGSEIPYGAGVPDLSVVVPFPSDFRRTGQLTGDDGPPALPRHELSPDAAQRIPDHGVLITAVDTRPLALEVQRRLVEAGVPSRQIVKIVDHLMSTVHSEQAMKNRSQWLLTSGLTSEAVRYKTSRSRSTEDSLHVTSTVLRMEPVTGGRPGSREMPIETRIRDDLGRRTAMSSTAQEGDTLNGLVGLKIDVGHTDKIVVRAGANARIGKHHSIGTSDTDVTKVNFLEKADIVLYDAVVRLHVTSENMNTFDVDVRMEMALPVREADRFERDIFGEEPTPVRGEFANVRDQAAESRNELAHVREESAIPHTGPVQPYGEGPRAAYEPHPREPLTLAAGRGPGLGTPARLTGSEHLVKGIRAALTEAAPGLPPDALRQVLRDLDAHFGRPALESDLTHLLNGIDYRTTVSGHRIEVSARGTLDALHGAEEYPLTVNDRRTVGAALNTGWTTVKAAGFELSGNVRLKVDVKEVFGIKLPKLGVDFPKMLVRAMTGSTDKTAFASGHSVYRRTETEGTVTVFKRAVPIEAELRVTRKGEEVVDISWRVDGSTAEIVVPHQHVPQQPVSAQDVAGVGRIEPLDRRPGDVLDLSGHPAGVIRIGAMPDLALEVAKAHAGWTGLPSPEGRRDVPAEILELTRPSYLEANIGLLTSPDGMTIDLPEHGGWSQALRVKVGMAGLEHTRAGSEVEYEHYTNANSRVITGKGRTRGLEAQAMIGTRATLGGSGEAGAEHKLVAMTAATFSAGRVSNESAYAGGADVARATYGADSHWYRGDLVVEVTPIRWKGSSVEQGQTTGLRVHQIMDFMTPDRVARHLGLEGPAPAAAVVPEPRAYISPELAMSSAYVEHLAAGKVLPELVKIFHEQRILFEGEELTTSPVMEALRSQYNEQALSANLLSLRTGVTTWIPVERGRGLTDYIGVRVRAVVLDGAHTAERPDVKLMLRSENVSGAGTMHEAGSGHGARALARYGRYAESTITGAEASARSTSDSGTSHVHTTNVKEIDRVQTSDPSHEFTHPVRYEIEVVRSQEPPPGLDHLARGARGALHKWAELTGNDAAERFWDRRRPASTSTGVTDGELRLIVPEHVTVPVAEGTPVTAQTVVAGEAPRWSRPVTPLAVNATLGEVAHQVAVPAALLIEQWAPVAALPPKLQGPVPRLSDRPLGYELSRPRGMLLDEAGSPRTARANLKALLAHEYVIPGLGKVGIQVLRAEPVAEASVKQRVYRQTMTSTGHGHSDSREREGHAGGSAGPTSESTVGLLGAGGGRGSGEEAGSRNSNIRERNLETSTETTYYRCAISLVFRGEGRDLMVDVPDGLYIRLSAADVERINREHPGFIFSP
ncbi:hypothetical protein [Streptosporangium roseum]|uniref:hypothetical protein n=1 Tax=Streptosporangium roseum TaxID=2001 RepID=UPI0004CCB449|nr:hypothetical protein [Streptosporangium roseum]